MINPNDIGTLLRIKRAREELAEAALRQAQAARARALKARGRAEGVAADFGKTRLAREAAIYRQLGTGPVPAGRLHLAVAQLAEVAAYANLLDDRRAQAARHEAACTETLEAAQRSHAVTLRESLGVATAQRRLDAAARSTEECHQEADFEELAGRGHPALPAASIS